MIGGTQAKNATPTDNAVTCPRCFTRPRAASTTKYPSAIASSTNAGAAEPTCDAITNDATTIANGSVQWSPHATLHVRNTKTSSGSTITYGFHGNNNVLPPSAF